MANKIAIRDIESAIREAMSGSEIQFSDSVYEEKDGKLRLIIFFNKLFSTENVVLYTKLLFEVDDNKEYLSENKNQQNFFKYLYDINCQYKMKIIDDINDFKNQWSQIIKENNFGPNIKILSEFIKQPSFLVNDWFNKNNVKYVSLTGFKYEPKLKIMPCKSLSFHFVLTVNNSEEVELYIRKEGKNDYIYTFSINGKSKTIEKSDLTTLVQTIGETLKDNIIGKSENESYNYEVDEWVPVPLDYELKEDEEIKVKLKSPKYHGNYIGTIIKYIDYFNQYRIDWGTNPVGAFNLDKYDILIRNPFLRQIKWFKKGNFIREGFEDGESYIGRKVKVSKDSPFHDQAYINSGDGYGVIIEGPSSIKWYRIKWNSGYENVYRLFDFELVNDEPIEKVNIKWYKNGKFFED